MTKNLTFDDILRLFVSVCFRGLILLCSYLIVNNFPNSLPSYIYPIFTLIYILTFTLTINKEGLLSKVRLLNDFLLISVVLYGKSINNFPLSFFLLLPIINAQNHSGKRQSIFLYLVTILTYELLAWGEQSVYFWSVLIVVTAINALSYFRRFYSRRNDELYRVIDNFDVQKLSLGKTHYLYNELIEKINSNSFASYFFKTNKILCLRIEDDEFKLFNSSKFVWSYKIEYDSHDIAILKEEKTRSRLKVLINSNIYNNTIFFPLYYGEKLYVFLFIIHEEVKQNRRFINAIIYRNLKPLLIKILRVIELDNKLRNERAAIVKQIKDKLRYVNNARLAMHFLRNKMTSITTYFEMVDNFNDFKTDDIILKTELKELIDVERAKVKFSLKSIVEKTDQILEKANNPFIIEDLETVPAHALFHVLRRIWLEYSYSDNITIHWNIENINQDFALNIDGLEILFTDVIENMSTYYKKYKEIILDEDEDNYYINFKNDLKYNTTHDMVVLYKIVEDFNSEDNYEISKRKTHGLSIIKEFLKQMKIKHLLDVRDNIFTLQLIFPKKL